MSESAREWQFYIRDMLDFTEQALAYTRGLDQAAFLAHRMVYDATLRNIELIGEAATHVPDTVRQAHSHIPWRLVIATRNRLIHGYWHRQRHRLEHRAGRLAHTRNAAEVVAIGVESH